MSTIDDLREVLAALERLAPEAVPDVAGPRHDRPALAVRRRRSLLAVIACVVSVCAVAAGITLSRHHRSPASAALPAPTTLAARPTPTTLAALGCPATLGSPASTWVPGRAQGFDSKIRLAPSGTPQQLTICSYPGKDSPVGPAGAIRLSANLGPAAEVFSQVPPADQYSCDLMLEPTDGDRYLVRLRYEHATVWIAVSGDHCAGVSNGEFTSSTFLGALVSSWYSTGEVTSAPQPTCSGTYEKGVLAGRLAQGTEMVPDHPVWAELCGQTPGDSTTDISGATLAGLVSAINHLPTGPMSMPLGCRPTGPTSLVHDYRLIFHYSSGPDAVVLAFSGCTPQVENGSLAIESAPAVVSRIQQLAQTHK